MINDVIKDIAFILFVVSFLFSLIKKISDELQLMILDNLALICLYLLYMSHIIKIIGDISAGHSLLVLWHIAEVDDE